jgi:hypothetical protein
LGVVADVRNLFAGAFDDVNEELILLRAARLLVNDNFNHARLREST